MCAEFSEEVMQHVVTCNKIPVGFLRLCIQKGSSLLLSESSEPSCFNSAEENRSMHSTIHVLMEFHTA